VPIVLKSGSLNLLEPSGPVQACNGIALHYNKPKAEEHLGYKLTGPKEEEEEGEGYRHTLRISNTYCFSTSTMGMRTRLNITFICTFPVFFNP